MDGEPAGQLAVGGGALKIRQVAVSLGGVSALCLESADQGWLVILQVSASEQAVSSVRGSTHQNAIYHCCQRLISKWLKNQREMKQVVDWFQAWLCPGSNF